jgi:pimeloyl-ACP methyl ester carboxylesterase
MYLSDRAAHVFELILANRDLQQGEVIFVGHSLGGLIIKELLRKASDEAQSGGRDRAGKLVERSRKAGFLATGGFSGLARPPAGRVPAFRGGPFLGA